ncbi:aminotransferase class IV [Patulibacter defluvii]|uniref:aminotransferase class IV n=1 Tax=Patulibacter defluvii TaxID=3095358 RepID=UPI002A75B51D|nr:aminotransferase class IV [Patulibacter sp. DM4]
MPLGGPTAPVFETVRVEDGRIRLWERHLLRLRRAGAGGRQLTAVRALAEVYRRGGGPTIVRFDVARGTPVAARARPVSPATPVRLATVPGYDPHDRDREQKRADRAWAAAAERRAAASGADEPLLVATGGRDEVLPSDRVGESSRASLFAVDAGGRIATPPVAGLLPGVTRSWVLEAARVRELPLRVGELVEARAAFLATAGRGIVPVAAIDGRALTRDPLVGDLLRAWLRLP